jgi:hypothetical protein
MHQDVFLLSTAPPSSGRSLHFVAVDNDAADDDGDDNGVSTSPAT